MDVCSEGTIDIILSEKCQLSTTLVLSSTVIEPPVQQTPWMKEHVQKGQRGTSRDPNI